jgi:integrase
MASIERRTRAGRVRWLVRYRDPTGRQRAKTFDRKVDAETWLAETQVALASGRWRDPARGRMTLAAWWAAWWPTTTASLRASTRARDESYWRAYVEPTFGGWPLAGIDRLAVQRWIADLAGRGLSPATTGKAGQLLSKVLAAAVDAGALAENPARRVKVPSVDREPPRFLTPAEVARLAAAIHPQYRALVLLAAYGGLRVGELAALRREHVDLLRGEVTVAATLAEVGGHLVEGPPKTRAARRRVGLPRPVVEELAAHLLAFGTSDPGARVFTAPEGGPLRVNAFRGRAWRPAVAAAGLAPLTPHDLRHTAVALWIAAGASPKEVAQRAGHTSVKTALDVYGGLYEEAETALRGRLEELYAAGAESAEPGDVVPLDRGRRR